MLCFLATKIFTDGHCNSEFGGMDRAEEVDVLKREIGPFAGDYWARKYWTAPVPAGSDYNSDRVSEPVWRRSAVGGTKLCPFGFSGTRSGTGFGSGFGSGGFLQPDKSMANVNTKDTTNGVLVWLISGRDCSSIKDTVDNRITVVVISCDRHDLLRPDATLWSTMGACQS
jgi:hypothetical protein